ncbi:MAG: FHA domain-containing protein [Pirellulaceae bacterium]|nr:FHA domain-containing protein [Pirellulaceae bacterium]
MQYKIVLLNTSEGFEQLEWTLRLPATLGRGQDLEVCIGHSSISREHCQFALNAEGALTVRDLGSMNGTYVGDERIKTAVLMPGSIVQVGAITLRVDLNPDKAEMKSSYGKGSNVQATQPMKIVRPNPNQR